MIWFMALMMLLFEGLAICTIGGMITVGINAGLAMVAAILEVTIGVVIVRVMYRNLVVIQ